MFVFCFSRNFKILPVNTGHQPNRGMLPKSLYKNLFVQHISKNRCQEVEGKI